MFRLEVQTTERGTESDIHIGVCIQALENRCILADERWRLIKLCKTCMHQLPRA